MNPLLTEENLKTFIENLNIAQEQKNFLLDQLPSLGEKERMDLLNSLAEVSVLDEEKKQAIEKIKNNWKNLNK